MKAIEKEEQNRSSKPRQENKIATDVSNTQEKKVKSNRKRKMQKNRDLDRRTKQQKTFSKTQEKKGKE